MTAWFEATQALAAHWQTKKNKTDKDMGRLKFPGGLVWLGFAQVRGARCELEFQNARGTVVCHHSARGRGLNGPPQESLR